MVRSTLQVKKKIDDDDDDDMCFNNMFIAHYKLHL